MVHSKQNLNHICLLLIGIFLLTGVVSTPLMVSAAGNQPNGSVKGVCPRLEGQNFLCEDGGNPPICTVKSCNDAVVLAATNKLTPCQSVRLCNGNTCKGTKALPTCTGTCYSPTYVSVPYNYMRAGGTSCISYGQRETCTITEAGKDCKSERYCEEYGTTEASCVQATKNCVSGYTATPNELRSCGCACGSTGQTMPATPACSATSTCQP